MILFRESKFRKNGCADFSQLPITSDKILRHLPDKPFSCRRNVAGRQPSSSDAQSRVVTLDNIYFYSGMVGILQRGMCERDALMSCYSSKGPGGAVG